MIRTQVSVEVLFVYRLPGPDQICPSELNIQSQYHGIMSRVAKRSKFRYSRLTQYQCLISGFNVYIQNKLSNIEINKLLPSARNEKGKRNPSNACRLLSSSAPASKTCSHPKQVNKETKHTHLFLAKHQIEGRNKNILRS